MNLIYSHSYTSARTFAMDHELMPGDWKWIHDTDVIRQYPRADVYKAPKWDAHPHRAEIDEALEFARTKHRLGALNDFSASSSSTLGVSGG
jgi:hypothetical protein